MTEGGKNKKIFILCFVSNGVNMSSYLKNALCSKWFFPCSMLFGGCYDYLLILAPVTFLLGILIIMDVLNIFVGISVVMLTTYTTRGMLNGPFFLTFFA